MSFILNILMSVGPHLITFFFRDLLKRQEMQNRLEAFVKEQQTKGAKIADSMDQLQAQDEELKKTRGE